MEAAFYVLFVLFILAEVFIAIKYVQKGKSKCLKSILVPAGLYIIYLLTLCIFFIRVPYFVLSLATITIFLHTYVGLYLDMYRKSKIYDRYLHGFGSFSFALLLYLTLSGITVPGGTVVYRAVFVASIGIASGAVFEIVEFLHDLKSKTDMQRGLIDTDFDLIFDVIGSAAAAILAAIAYL
jgi:hypothetical protein